MIERTETTEIKCILLSLKWVCAVRPNETMQPFFVDFELIYAR